MNQEALEKVNELVSLGESMNRLLNNEDFKRVFLDKFLKDDVILEGLGMYRVPEDKRHLPIQNLTARGVFHNFIRNIIDEAVIAKDFLSTSKGDN